MALEQITISSPSFSNSKLDFTRFFRKTSQHIRHTLGFDSPAVTSHLVLLRHDILPLSVTRRLRGVRSFEAYPKLDSQLTWKNIRLRPRGYD